VKVIAYLFMNNNINVVKILTYCLRSTPADIKVSIISLYPDREALRNTAPPFQKYKNNHHKCPSNSTQLFIKILWLYYEMQIIEKKSNL